MILQTTMFGELDIDESAIYRFPDGLPGFEGLTSFALVEAEELRPLAWLVPVDEPDLSFPLADPKYFIEDYQVAIGPEDREVLDVDGEDEVAIYAIVSLPRDGNGLRANLRGPLVLNLGNHVGRQIILVDERYSHHQPARFESERAQAS